jgi:hypothetical protein
MPQPHLYPKHLADATKAVTDAEIGNKRGKQRKGNRLPACLCKNFLNVAPIQHDKHDPKEHDSNDEYGDNTSFNQIYALLVRSPKIPNDGYALQIGDEIRAPLFEAQLSILGHNIPKG